MTKSPRQRAARGEGERLRVEILDAAERLLVDAGSADRVSVRAIAETVGVTPPSIYRHFVDKEQLVHEVCERRFGDLNETFVEAKARSNDPLERLRELGRAYGNFALRHPEHYRLLMMTSTPISASEEFKRGDSQGRIAFQHLVDAVAECIQAGRIVGGDPTTTAVVLWSGMHGLVSLLITSPDFPWPADPEQLVETVLDAQMEALEPKAETL